MSKFDIVDLTGDGEISTSASMSTTPQPEKNIPLYDQYEDKTEEVKKQFVILKENQYINRLKNVYSASNEFMTCDCIEETDNGINIACGVDSDCINRLTKIECVDDQCGCGDHCLNQRFQCGEYANVSIFLTSNKGYGMRANVDIPEHTFLIEYMGEIVDSLEYKERKEKYDVEGIKHFYFMMIQDNEIIDATKKASLGRYCNHSCDPNAYVEKWVVNKRYRMGIFAKRKILKGEEICFDYNVDRYGAEPQKCYCGADNCIGVMGGKTQSETVRLLPHIITEALGVRASDEKRWLKEQKKNGIKVTTDNIDSNVNVEFVKSLELSPLGLLDVAKISSCLMQPDLDLIVIERILERFLITGDESLENLLNRLNRLHGLQALGHTLKAILSANIDNKSLNLEQNTVLDMILYMLEHWPTLKSKNTIQNSELEETLKTFQDRGLSAALTTRINSLMNSWSSLEVIYRIPKKLEGNTSQTILYDRRSRSTEGQTPSIVNKLPTGPSSQLKQLWGDLDVSKLPANRKLEGQPLPPGWEWATDSNSNLRYFYNRSMNSTQWDKPEWPVPEKSNREDEEKRRRKEREREREKVREMRDLRVLERERALKRQSELKEQEQRFNILSSIIADASKNDSNVRSGKSVPKFRSKEHKKSVRIDGHATLRSDERSKSNDASAADNRVDNKKKSEKKWMELFASYIPNALKKYEAKIGRDNLKHCARDIVHLLTSKELKRHFDEPVPAVLTEERKYKIKAFTREYMQKFLQKLEERKKRKAEDVNADSDFELKKQKV